MSIEPGKTWGFPGIYYNYLIQPMKRVDLYGFQLQLQVEVNVSACNVAITGCEKSRLWQKALHPLHSDRSDETGAEAWRRVDHVDHRSSADIDELGPKF